MGDRDHHDPEREGGHPRGPDRARRLHGEKPTGQPDDPQQRQQLVPDEEQTDLAASSEEIAGNRAETGQDQVVRKARRPPLNRRGSRRDGDAGNRERDDERRQPPGPGESLCDAALDGERRQRQPRRAEKRRPVD